MHAHPFPCSRLNTSFRLKLAVLLSLCGAVLLGQSGGMAAAAGTPAPEVRYDAFLFSRNDASVVLGRIQPDKIDLRQVGQLAAPSSAMFYKPLCVRGGVLYGVGVSGLIATDLTSGASTVIQPHLASSGSGAWIYRAGMLYDYTIQPPSAAALSVYDFARRARRRVALKDAASPRIPRLYQLVYQPEIAVSPDGRRLATFVPKSEPGIFSTSRVLRIYDLQTGTFTSPMTEGIDFIPDSDSCSGALPTPPLDWIDDRTILCVRTEDPEQKNHPGGWGPATRNVVSTIDVATGKMETLAQVPATPGRALFDRITLSADGPGLPPSLQCHMGTFEVDLQNRRLVEEGQMKPTVARFRVVEHKKAGTRQLFFGDRPLCDPAIVLVFKIAPDGQQVLWRAVTPDQVPASRIALPYFFKVKEPSPLRFFDAREGKVRQVEGNSMIELKEVLWLDSRDLAPGAKPAPIPPGWESFDQVAADAQARLAKIAASDPPDTRKEIQGRLTLSATTDKPVYRLHEPVKITVTLQNVSGEPVAIRRPWSVMHWLKGMEVKYPGGRDRSSLMRENYPPKPEEMTLQPGERLRQEYTLEVAKAGDYTFGLEYDGLDPRHWLGWVKGKPFSFTVRPSDEDARLFKEKTQRLLGQIRADFRANPESTSNPIASDSDFGLAAMGEAVAPVVIDALRTLDEARELNFRKQLYHTLALCGRPQVALPWLKDQLVRANADEVESLRFLVRRLCNSCASSPEVCAALMPGLANPDPKARRKMIEIVAGNRHSGSRPLLEQAVNDADETLAMLAAKGLAQTEGLSLADWLRKAAEAPDKTRYLAARAVVTELEQTWGITQGAMPDAGWAAVEKNPALLKQYQTTLQAWAAWAGQHPRAAAGFAGQ